MKTNIHVLYIKWKLLKYGVTRSAASRTTKCRQSLDGAVCLHGAPPRDTTAHQPWYLMREYTIVLGFFSVKMRTSKPAEPDTATVVSRGVSSHSVTSCVSFVSRFLMVARRRHGSGLRFTSPLAGLYRQARTARCFGVSESHRHW